MAQGALVAVEEQDPVSERGLEADEERDAMRAQVRRRLSEGLSQNKAAREIGISAATLSQWLTGTYPASTDELDKKVKRWVRLSESRETLPIPQRPQWVETPTARRVAAALVYAQNAGNMAIIHGGAGTGKTYTARAYAQQHPNVWLVSCAPSTGTLIDTLDEVAWVLGEKGIKGRPAHYRRALLTRLRDTQGLLIMDEAQEMCVRALNELSRLCEDAGIGLALMGNDEIYTRLTGGTRAAAFARLFSRIAYRVRLSQPKSKDVDLILDAWRVKDVAARKLAHDVASQPGGLRSMSNAVGLAASWAHGKDLSPEMLQRAVRKCNDEKAEG